MNKVKKILYTSKYAQYIGNKYFKAGEVIELLIINLVVGKEGSIQFINRTGEPITMQADAFNKKFIFDRVIYYD